MGRLSLVVLLLVSLAATSAFRLPEIFNKPSSKNDSKIVDWALLVAGSAGWGNYRHQADVCHAYQVLRKGGLDDDHIVVMMADDLANNILNPHPGKLFNRPYGPDVYDGVPLDYTGENVNADTFLKVLLGSQNESVLIGSSGKTIQSGPDDRVFVYYADHGAPGIVGMPSGSFLYADQLLKTVQKKSAQKGFKDMVIYMEACEAGSMFQGLLTDDLNVYATTAANAEESSWGTYCPGMAPTPPSEFDTCLGDLYSVAWMENSDHYDLRKESLEQQFERVRKRTSNGGTFMQGSHVMQYGSLSIDAEPTSDYLGILNTGDGVSQKDNAALTELENAGQAGIAQREADLVPLWTAIARAKTGTDLHEAHARLAAELDARYSLDSAVRMAVLNVLQNPAVASVVKANNQLAFDKEPKLQEGGYYITPDLSPPVLAWAYGEVEGVSSELVEAFVTEPLIARSNDLPLVDDWDCLRGMVQVWETAYGFLGQYGMQHTRVFANLCNSGVTPADFVEATASLSTLTSPLELDLDGDLTLLPMLDTSDELIIEDANVGLIL